LKLCNDEIESAENKAYTLLNNQEPKCLPSLIQPCVAFTLLDDASVTVSRRISFHAKRLKPKKWFLTRLSPYYCKSFNKATDSGRTPRQLRLGNSFEEKYILRFTQVDEDHS